MKGSIKWTFLNTHIGEVITKMGQNLHWQIRSKPFGEKDIIIDYREISNDPTYDVLDHPRKGLDILFDSRVTDDMDEKAIFPNASNHGDYGCYDYLTLKELIEKLEGKRFYEARKKYIDELTKDSGRYEKIIQVIKSFEKFGLPEEIEIGLMIC